MQARALLDASISKAPGMELAEKRTAIEVKISVERMEVAGESCVDATHTNNLQMESRKHRPGRNWLMS